MYHLLQTQDINDHVDQRTEFNTDQYFLIILTTHLQNNTLHKSYTMSLSGKVALITGSSQGIGKATALRLASEGASLVINYRSDSAAANSVVEQIGADRALAVQADASKLPDLDRLVEATVARFGKIDILIPNAGISAMKDLESTTEEDFDNSHNLMVKGPYFLAQVR